MSKYVDIVLYVMLLYSATKVYQSHHLFKKKNVWIDVNENVKFTVKQKCTNMWQTGLHLPFDQETA